MTRSLGSETGFEANPIHPVADDGQPRGRNRCQSKIWGNATGRWEPDELRGSRPVLRGPGGDVSFRKRGITGIGEDPLDP